jgi:Fe-S cluster biosynthesis and repair protein YggX
MTHTIFCTKLKKELAGLDYPPYPGELGKKIYQSISQEAWQTWLARQTMFINEYRLNMLDAQAREFLRQEMEKFLFTDDDSLHSGYRPQNNENP